MKRFFLLLLAVLLLAGPRASHAQVATWATPLPLPGVISNDDVRTVTDAAGNTYVAGRYNVPSQVGTTILPAPRVSYDYNGLLLKISPAGAVQWAIPAMTAESMSMQGITLDAFGNVCVIFHADSTYLTTVSPSITFGSRALPGAGTVLARVSPAGVVNSLTYLHRGITGCYVAGFAADGMGNCFLGVSSPNNSGVDQFGPYSFPSATGNYYQGATSAIMRVDPAGTLSLVKGLVPTPVQTPSGPTAYCSIHDLEVGPTGDIYLTGSVAGTLVLNTAPAITLTGDQFVVRMAPSGVSRWALSSLFNMAAQFVTDRPQLAVGGHGEVYLAGSTMYTNFAWGGLPVGLGSYLVRISSQGVPQWARSTGAAPSRYESLRSGGQVAVDARGNVARVGLFDSPSISLGGLTLNHPVPALVNGNLLYCLYVASFDSTGTVRWGRTLSRAQPIAPNTYYNNQAFALNYDPQGNLYLLARAEIPLQMDGKLVQNPSLLRLEPGGTLSGTLYIDQNNNGQRDASEGPMPYPQLITDAGQNLATASTAGTGEYRLSGVAGSAFSISPASLHPAYTLGSPTVRTGTFPATGGTTSGLDFGLVPIANRTDLRLALTAYSPSRPGFTTRYRLTLENMGSTSIPAGTATLTLDALMQYISSTPAGTVAGRVLSLPYAALAPFGVASYDLLFSLPTNTALGTVLNTIGAAPVAGDVAPADNTATLAQTVVGSFDPNSMEVNYQRLTPAQVAAKQPLDYTIHFQNLGTAPAQNVILSDTLNFQKLNPATLLLVAQSHNCLWSLTSTGPNTGLLTVRFLGINLPEQNTDVIRSMGFVRFRVQPRPTLAVGEIIPNRASIVFDYNDGIRTNTATTTVFVATAALARHEAPAWEAYPNPATDVLTVALDLPAAGPVRVELLDGLGRAVRHQVLAAPAGPLRQQLDLRGLAPGLYVLRLTPPTGPALSRQVVRN